MELRRSHEGVRTYYPFSPKERWCCEEERSNQRGNTMVDKKKLGNIAAKVVRIVPGIGTYQDKETLRDIDKRLRDYLALILDRERGRINDVKKLLTRNLKLDPLDDLERIARKMHQVGDTIKFAAYGWSPVFGQASVDKQRLENLYEFDRLLEDHIAVIQRAVDTLIADPEKSLDTGIAEVERSLGALDDTLRRREELLKQV